MAMNELSQTYRAALKKEYDEHKKAELEDRYIIKKYRHRVDGIAREISNLNTLPDDMSMDLVQATRNEVKRLKAEQKKCKNKVMEIKVTRKKRADKMDRLRKIYLIRRRYPKKGKDEGKTEKILSEEPQEDISGGGES